MSEPILHLQFEGHEYVPKVAYDRLRLANEKMREALVKIEKFRHWTYHDSPLSGCVWPAREALAEVDALMGEEK